MTETKIIWILKDILKAEVRLDELKPMYEMQEGDIKPIKEILEKIKLSFVDELVEP